MDQVSRAFLEKSRKLVTFDYVPKIERCLDVLDETDVWWRPNEASNSIGNLILHLCGNVGMWMLGGVGRLPFERHRQLEFDERRAVPTAELRRRMSAIVRQADEVMSAIEGDELLSRRQIQGYDVTVLEAIYHVVEHFGMHTGQIILLAKARAGGDLRLWEPPAP
ncbi:MAG: DUF1572 domain-containing protein [Acidobacteria bacterium]|nr:MAG: DUF1572 domain-containing protein [Acidobacteriota bacterium]